MYIKDIQYSASAHMKLKLYYFAAVVHVFIALHSKLRVAFNNVYVKDSTKKQCKCNNNNNNIDTFETLLRKGTFGFIDRLEKK